MKETVIQSRSGRKGEAMERRKFDKLGIETSLLGFGCMRFPVKADGSIDEELSEKMLDLAMASGVTYYDTAYPYHNGDSEPFLGRILDKYDRSSYYLATKLPCWQVASMEDAKRIFNEQLERLHKDYIDFYLLHALNKDRWSAMKKLGVPDYCRQLKKEGKIRYFGFSFHDDYETFEDILNYGGWDFCQIQYNYMDTEEQAGDRGYTLAKKLGVPLVVMEPVKGGSLASLPDEIAKQLKNARPLQSVASWALRWVGTHENVKVVLSGMSSMEQVEDNLKTFKNFMPLSSDEQALITDTAETLKGRIRNGCTACRYCMPCPAGVNIPRNFAIWNHYNVYGGKEQLKEAWNERIPDSEKAYHCVRCGKCESVCPQKLNIRDNLETLQKELDCAVKE